jgi:hypothetical protein
MIRVHSSPALLRHLQTYEVDGTTVEDSLFIGGRLSYPGRQDIEYQLADTDPYTIMHEARVIEGLPRATIAAIKYLAGVATEAHRGIDLTLDLLWTVHGEYSNRNEGPSLDRLIAALVTIQDFKDEDLLVGTHKNIAQTIVFKAAEEIVGTFHRIGFPLSSVGLEELFDGADPACLGLGLVELAS